MGGGKIFPFNTMKAYRSIRSTATLSKYWPDFKNGIFNINNNHRDLDNGTLLICDRKMPQVQSLPTGIKASHCRPSTSA